jgi:hypothetical protein
MTHIGAQPPFRIPSTIAADKHVDFCVRIINQYRQELPWIRERATKLQDKTKDTT